MKYLALAAILLAAAVTLEGCAGLRRDDYDQVRVGRTTRESVRGILGQPWAGADGDLWLYIPEHDGNVRVEIEFGPDGTVSAKRWLDYSPDRARRTHGATTPR